MTKLTQDAIEQAYQKLERDDRLRNRPVVCEDRERTYRTPDKPFGKLQALELLAKLGVWMVKNE